ncbi:hypothetical protein NPIL_301791 [Nephila pilipes]|uniref:Uncharacterized protein n=1 Tax=Nephila pilipes TaxID=299642 RepID=A0A8X6PK62_NEPPI|nr:hypothetical protein NPIL_301791 [Nephila pilipes]
MRGEERQSTGGCRVRRARFSRGESILPPFAAPSKCPTNRVVPHDRNRALRESTNGSPERPIRVSSMCCSPPPPSANQRAGISAGWLGRLWPKKC